MQSGNVQIENELNKVRSTTKRLAKVCMQIREEIPKREQEVKKYQERVDLLEQQYQQYAPKNNLP